jgi:peroxiredoxin
LRLFLTRAVLQGKNRHRVRLLLAALTVITLLILILGCESSSSAVTTGSQAPDFKLTTLDGRQVKLSDFKGKVVVLNMWATWCGYCRVEMPDIEAAYQKNRDQGVVVLAINAQEGSSEVSQFVKDEGLSFPILLDPDGTVNRAYHVSALPTTFFIDGEGIVRFSRMGQMSAQTISDGLNAASKGAIR